MVVSSAFIALLEAIQTASFALYKPYSACGLRIYTGREATKAANREPPLPHAVQKPNAPKAGPDHTHAQTIWRAKWISEAIEHVSHVTNAYLCTVAYARIAIS